MAKIDTGKIIVVNEGQYTGAEKLINQQNEVGDPLNGNGGAPSDFWAPSPNDSNYPISAYFDLSVDYELSNICLYDTLSKGEFKIQAGAPGDWYTLIQDETDGFNEWKTYGVKANTRYIRVILHEADALIGEMVLYGEEIKTPEPTAKPTRLKISQGNSVIFDSFIEESTSLTMDFIVEEQDDDPDNFIPQVSQIPNRTDKVGDSVEFRVSAIDFEGDPLTFSSVGFPSGVDINSTTGWVRGTISGASGSYSATVRVSDGKDTVVRSFAWQVNPKDITPPPPNTSGDRSFDQFAGMCCLPDDPAEIVAAGGYVRPYILSKWKLYDVDTVNAQDLVSNPEKLEFAFNPDYTGGSWVENGLRSYKAAGVDVAPSFKESFMFLTNNSKPDLDNKPRLLSEDGNDPYSWRFIGIYFYQYAARYGDTKVDDSKLLLRGDQQRKSGEGLVKYIQLENEADKWWLGGDSEFTPEEWAAYHSVCYDGHMGEVSAKVGLGVGVKEADPTMKVISGPLAHLNYDYLNRAVDWWKANRTKSGYPVIPLDGFSFHRYANTSGTQQRNLSGKGMAPEPFGFLKYYEDFKKWVDDRGAEFGQEFESWTTEFGYDTNTGSPQGVVTFAGKDAEQVQAEWMVRTYLLGAAAGLDRMAMYMLRNVNDGGGGIFQTCGYTSTKGAGWKKKKSWYAFKTMVDALKGLVFEKSLNTNREDVMAYQFGNESRKVLAIWCPTQGGKTVSNFAIAGKVVNVSEMPVFVEL